MESPVTRADALWSEGRFAEARRVYQDVLARSPDDTAALFGLSRLALDEGRWIEAGVHLAKLPSSPQRDWLAGRMALGRGDHAGARATLQELLATDLPPPQRAETLLLLSEALEGLNRPSEAFAAAIAGKAIQRRIFAPLARAREPIVERYARLRAAFQSADAGDWASAPGATATPVTGHVFLVGFPRSGTTLLEQALAGSAAVCSLEEAPTLGPAHDEFLGSASGLRRLASLAAEDAERQRARYWEEVRGAGADPAGRIFVDKAPAATDDLPLVAKLFPDARVLFAIRDPRDVVLSCLRQNFRMNALTYAFTDLTETARAYDASMALAETYRRVLPLPVMEVRHEALVGDFEAGLREVCAFIGARFEPTMLEVAATASHRPVRTPSAPQVRAGLNAGGLGRWRRYEAELAPVQAMLLPWVERFGYS